MESPGSASGGRNFRRRCGGWCLEIRGVRCRRHPHEGRCLITPTLPRESAQRVKLPSSPSLFLRLQSYQLCEVTWRWRLLTRKVEVEVEEEAVCREAPRVYLGHRLLRPHCSACSSSSILSPSSRIVHPPTTTGSGAVCFHRRRPTHPHPTRC